MLRRRRVYLDYAAAFPPRRAALRAFARAQKYFGNPSSPHEEGREARAVLEDARVRIARLVEAKADDVVFTSGATEANALVLKSFARPGAHILIAASAHASLVENARAAGAAGAVVEEVPLRDGRIDEAQLGAMLRPETALVALEAVCGETGTRWDTRRVKQLLEHARSRAVLHVDASQAALTEKLSRAHFGADLLVLDAGKVGGVRGIGCVVAHRTLPLGPLYAGGGQERGLRPGTEQPALAAAFAEALARCASERESFSQGAEQARRVLLAQVQKHLSGVLINESPDQVPHILNISLPGRDTDYLVALLDEAGFAVSTKSACETDSEEGSRAVFAIFGDPERAKTTLRMSFGPTTSAAELRRFVRALVTAVEFIDNA